MTKKGNLQCGGIIILIMIIMFTCIHIKDTHDRLNSLEEVNESLSLHLGIQSKRIVDLYKQSDYQAMENASYQKQIDNNLEYINQDQKRIIQNAIDIDAVSHEHCETLIKDLEDDIKLLEKKVEWWKNILFTVKNFTV